MRPVQTLVVIAEEKAARLYLSPGAGSALVLLSALEFADFAGGDVEFSDRAGRWTPGPGIAPHVLDHRESERELERSRFAARLAEAIEAAAGSVDRIAIAAAPRMLGLLRAAMPAPLRARVAAELDKDLTWLPTAELPERFAGVIVL